MDRSQKEKAVDDFKKIFEEAEAVIVTQYKGINAQGINDLRTQSRSSNVTFRVTQNRLIKIALEGGVYENISELPFPIMGTFNASANTYTVVDPDATFKNRNLAVGDALLLAGATQSANNTFKYITAINAAYTVLTLDSVTGNDAEEMVEFTAQRVVFQFNWDYAVNYSKDLPTLSFSFTNGILCKNGITIRSTSWTNIEAYVLYS